MKKLKIKLFAIITVLMIVAMCMFGFHLCEKYCKDSELDIEIVDDENTQGTTWLTSSMNEVVLSQY